MNVGRGDQTEINRFVEGGMWVKWEYEWVREWEREREKEK